ncbi:MAG: ATP-binding protein, partial [Dactylosporangium sp.]|nr:ATP-binding protein [Dactylosporangium sp.]
MSPPDGPTTASIATATLTPAGAHLVWIQATSTPGSLPRLVLTGIPEAGLPETRDRIRAAVLNAGLRWPTSAITLTVAPQPLVEADCGLDLAFALAILTATGQLPPQALDHQIGALGELGLDGSLRPVHAGDQRRQALAHAGIRRLIIPEATDLPAAGRPVLWAASGLAQVVEQLRIGDVGCLPDPGSLPTPDLERMVVLAAAGGHHLLLTGCPAPVANLASLVVAELLPDLDATTAAEVGDLWWQAGQPRGRPRTPRPPWATTTGPLPAGTHRRPGPVSLAHHGVFFHPDLTRLGPTQLHLLQTVLDTRHVDPHPSSGHRPWPARAQLVLTHPDPTPARLGGLPDRLELHLPTPVAGPAPLGQG